MLEFTASTQLGDFRYDVSLEAHDELVVLFGHSGAGKSMTLQITAGLLKPLAGRIVIDGHVVFDSAARVNLPPQERGVGYVVQDLALFPNMSVARNIAFGMEGTRADRDARTRRLLELLSLPGFEGRMPATLSGGQRQRVALARALGRDARLLMLDEPFSALDDSLRRNMRTELLRLRAELGLSVLFVTHDLREAHLLADRLAVFDNGRVLQFGKRSDVFRKPVSRRVAELTGVANILSGVVVARGPRWVDVNVSGAVLRCGAGDEDCFRVGAAVDVALRAERINLRRGTAIDGENTNMMKAVIVSEHAYGSNHVLHFNAIGPGPSLEVEIAARPYEVMEVASQRQWTLELPPEDLHVMPESQSRATLLGSHSG